MIMALSSWTSSIIIQNINYFTALRIKQITFRKYFWRIDNCISIKFFVLIIFTSQMIPFYYNDDQLTIFEIKNRKT
ncbi:hypothetical protein V1478_016771 [Vespula squamosa]|uniref:Uncharacterized protein n=1 Tax=Vespula squamosa TaxID=30214 RepID=A0ABD2A0S3_VESSQ